MSAQDALAKARAWACENLTDSQAGKLCGMLSEVSRENAKLRELCDDFYKCLDTALYLAKDAGYPVMPDQKLFDSLYPRMRELGVEVPDV